MFSPIVLKGIGIEVWFWIRVGKTPRRRSQEIGLRHTLKTYLKIR
jgi:hypothetical protein